MDPMTLRPIRNPLIWQWTFPMVHPLWKMALRIRGYGYTATTRSATDKLTTKMLPMEKEKRPREVSGGPDRQLPLRPLWA